MFTENNSGSGLGGSSKASFNSFNDPLASKISWDTNRMGGSTHATHKLVTESNNLVFKNTTLSKMTNYFIALIFISFEVYFIIAFTHDHILVQYSAAAASVLPLITLYLIYKHNTKVMVFDRSTRSFWKGKPRHQTGPMGAGMVPTKEFNAPVTFSDIHALQIIAKQVRSNKTTFICYELNLVMKNAKRNTVVSHGKLNVIKENAKTISQFLSIPIWDKSADAPKAQTYEAFKKMFYGDNSTNKHSI